MKVGEKKRRSQTWSWLGAGEDLVALVERLALQLDPLLGAAEGVLELLQRAQAELALAEELGNVGGALGHLDQADRVAVVVGLAVALAVGGLVLVGVEGEDARRRRRRAGRRARARRSGRRPCAAAASPAAAVPGRRASGRAGRRRPRRRRPRPASRRSRRRSAARAGRRRPRPQRRSPRRGRSAPRLRRRRPRSRSRSRSAGLRSSRRKWKPRRSLASSGASIRACLTLAGPYAALKVRHAPWSEVAWGCKWACRTGSCCKVGESGVLCPRVEAQDRGGEAPPTSSLRS